MEVKVNNKDTKISAFIFFCIFSLNICINSFALTPPSNDVLINALSKNGESTQSIVDNKEIFFVYNAVPVSKIKSEDKLKELVFESNTDTIDMKDSNWVVTEYQPSNEYFERILSYDKNGKLFEAANLIYEDRNYTTIYTVDDLMSQLNDNALKASNDHKGEYVRITGKLSTIDSSGKYISLLPNTDFAIIGVTCYIKNEETKAKVSELSSDSLITLTGKITEVGEVLGYSLDIDNIE